MTQNIIDSQPNSLAFITSQAFSIHNFRGSLIRTLVAKGVKVYALAPDYDDTTRSAVLALGAIPIDSSLSRASINPLADLYDTWKLSRLLHSLNVDAVFAYFIKPVIYGSIAAWVARIPKRFAMIEGAGFVFNDEQNKTFFRRALLYFVIKLYRFSLSKTHNVFFLNREDQQLFVETRMVSIHKVNLVNGIGVDLNYFFAKPPVTQNVCFIMIARLLREKGVYDYASAARLVKARHPNVRFLLLGAIDVNPNSLTQSEIDSWVDEKLLECPGHIADVRLWIEQASVFVLPSYYREGVPRSTQEAMAMSRPVITTNAVGCRDPVEDGVNGFKIPDRNPEALAKEMMFFIEHPEMIAKMGEQSRLMAEKKFDAAKSNALILSTLGFR